MDDEEGGVLRKSDSVANILLGSSLRVMNSSSSAASLSKSCVNLSGKGDAGFRSRIPTPSKRPPVPPKPSNLSLLVFPKAPLKRETSSPPSLEALGAKRPSKIPLWKGSQDSLSSLSSSSGSGQLRPKKWESCSNLEMYRSPSVEKKRSRSRHSPTELSAKNKQMTESLKTLKSSYLQERDRQLERQKQQKERKISDEAEMYEASYMQLLRENSELQRSYTLLLSNSSPASSSSRTEGPELSRLREDLAIAEKINCELEASLSSRIGVPGRLIKDKKLLIRSNYVLAERLKTASEREGRLKTELSEAKDASDLLEFRVLELEEDKGRNQLKLLNASEKSQTLSCDSGTSSIATEDDLLESCSDFRKEKVSSTKSRLQALVENTPAPTDKSLLLQTVALFECLLSKIQELQNENEDLKKSSDGFDDLVLDLESSRVKLEKAMKENESFKKENEELVNRISSLNDDKALSESRAETRISELEKRLDMKNALDDDGCRGDDVEEEEEEEEEELCFKKVSAHLRRSKNGACSSSSGISSDVSDTENDSAKSPSNKEIFTESGIFVDEDQHVTVSTQTLDSSTTSPSSPSPTKEASVLDSRSDYESSEELEDLKEECRDLVVRKKELEYELEKYKEEIKTLKVQDASDQKITQLERIEFSLRNQLGEWEKKYRSLYQQNQMLLEEKCELEEADNDSRLNAQRLEQDYHLSFEKTLFLSDELSLERKAMARLKAEFEELQLSVEDSRNDSSYLEALVSRYEQRIFDLEELEVELREKLTLLESAFNVLSWWTRVTMSLGTRLTSAPMILHLPSGHEDEKEVEAMSCRVESCLKVRELAERLFLGQEENAMRIKELENSLDNSETHLRSNHSELEKLKEKENAYEETMARAETIIRDVELNYRNKISILEEEKVSLESQLNSKSGNSSLQSRLALSDEMEAELRDRISHLEESERELNAKLIEQKRLNSTLRKEIIEREDDLTLRITDMREENDKLSNSLRKRISDFERDSMDVRRKLSEAERESEDRYGKILRLESEISRLLLLSHDSPNAEHSNRNHSSSNKNTLRIRVRGLQKTLLTSSPPPSICSRDSVLDSSEEMNFSAYRHELMELQKELQSSNRRISESDKAIDGLKSEIRDVREQLLGITAVSSSGKFSREESNQEPTPLWSGEGGLVAITRDVEAVQRLLDNCRNCTEGSAQRILKESASALRNLSSVMCGDMTATSSFSDKLSRYESEENLICPSGVERSSHEAPSIDKAIQSHLGELKEKLIKMEKELNLVGEESKDLQEQLRTSKSNIKLKEKAIEESVVRVKELETLNSSLTQSLEKHSSKVDSLNSRFRETLDSKRQLEHKCNVKDFLIKSLVDVSATAASSSSSSGGLRSSVLINRLKETTFKPSYKGTDFNLDSLCHYLGSFRGRDRLETTTSTTMSLCETRSYVDESLFVSSDIRIAAKIDSSTILLTWSPQAQDSPVKAYLVYVSGVFHQRVNELWLGKALIHGLQTTLQFTLSIVGTGNQKDETRYSKEIHLFHEPNEDITIKDNP